MESLETRRRGELLDREIFHALQETQVLTAQYRQTDNRIQPHGSPGYRPPTPAAIRPAGPMPALARLIWLGGQALGIGQLRGGG